MDEIRALTRFDSELQMRWLVYTGNYEVITGNPDLYEVACNAFFDDKIGFYVHRLDTERTSHLAMLGVLLRVEALAALYSSKAEAGGARTAIESEYGIGSPGSLFHNADEGVQDDSDEVKVFTALCDGAPEGRYWRMEESA